QQHRGGCGAAVDRLLSGDDVLLHQQHPAEGRWYPPRRPSAPPDPRHGRLYRKLRAGQEGEGLRLGRGRPRGPDLRPVGQGAGPEILQPDQGQAGLVRGAPGRPQPREPGGPAAARQDPERRARALRPDAVVRHHRHPDPGAGHRHRPRRFRRRQAALSQDHPDGRRRRRRRPHPHPAADVLLPSDAGADRARLRLHRPAAAVQGHQGQAAPLHQGSGGDGRLSDRGRQRRGDAGAGLGRGARQHGPAGAGPRGQGVQGPGRPPGQPRSGLRHRTGRPGGPVRRTRRRADRARHARSRAAEPLRRRRRRSVERRTGRPGRRGLHPRAPRRQRDHRAGRGAGPFAGRPPSGRARRRLRRPVRHPGGLSPQGQDHDHPRPAGPAGGRAGRG
uniref:SH3 domain-containing protein n=1 Tax=Parastrongyloides trichosuri TaxID=131310 RepID=A0A0N5A0T8_PARTI